MTVGAVFSPCGRYRYTLRRELREPLVAATSPNPPRACAFIMLNPSTADATKNDPTIRRCIGFALRWGFDHLLVGNIFAWRDTAPKDMKLADDPVGPENDRYLRAICHEAELVVCAWGNHGAHRGRAAQVLELIRSTDKLPHCLKLTGDQQPEHPLYRPADTVPMVLRG